MRRISMGLRRMVGNQFIQKVTQMTFCLHAVKAVYRLPVAVGDHCRKSLGLMPARNAHVFIGIHLCQNKLTGVFGDQPRQQRGQHETRATPVCANIKQHRHVPRAINHKGLKVRLFDIKDKCHSL